MEYIDGPLCDRYDGHGDLMDELIRLRTENAILYREVEHLNKCLSRANRDTIRLQQELDRRLT